ncbi:MAG: hypothetical protein A2007_02435 [Verrucomicrobia bacterium GWC2_42_7]|nr:MAG: hypothetical protein A2007_02435 [Verrucomicrobia bacterium GWC2_42_7]
MNTLTGISNNLIQQQATAASSFAKDLLGATGSINSPAEFTSNFMNTIQKAASVSPIDSGAVGGISSSTSNYPVSGVDKISNSLENLVKAVDNKQKEADAEVKNVMEGKSDNLHQSVIKMQEAGLAFSLMVEVRNNLIQSYQEIMRTSV